MFKWKKTGRIFDPTKVQGKDWMKTHAQCPGTLVFDDFVRVYFACRPDPKDGKYVSRTTFLDLDRKDLTQIINIADKPILELGPTGSFDEFGIYPSSVIKEEREIRLYYAGWSRWESVPFMASVGLAVSKDNGVSFERYGQGGPILSQSPNDPFVISGARIRKFNNKWYLFYLSGRKWIPDEHGRMESVYKIRLAVSDDGINWHRDNRNIVADVIDAHECQAGGDVFYYEGKYHMYFSYHPALDFRNKENGYRIGYAYSDDLVSWMRDDTQAGISLSETGWDSEMQHYPHVFELDGNHYMLYNGNAFGKYGFGLAVLED
jgi:sucrose-6-phosphate hydrolase SacC (GH32 family)